MRRVGAPKSTIPDWIEDFRVYMPIVRQGKAAALETFLKKSHA